jgi:hypothetical protein
MITLVLGLLFTHLSDDITVSKVKSEAAADPASVWSKVGSIFREHSGPDHPAMGGGIIHVQ